MSTKILNVDFVEFRPLKRNPQQLLITTNGTVSTTGWEKPELLLLEIKPIDSIYQFDFCATPPTSNVAQLTMPISASYVFKEIPEDFKGVKINAPSNSIEQKTDVEEEHEGKNPFSISKFRNAYRVQPGLRSHQGELEIYTHFLKDTIRKLILTMLLQFILLVKLMIK